MKNIIVTGSSRGIGKCLVENLAKEGNNVLLNYNKSEKQALQIQRELKEDGFLIEIFKADVSKKSEVKKMIDYALNKWGYIDVLINNAGIAKLNLFQNVTEEEWDEIINTNLKSAFCATQLVLPSMINRKNGLIINISSMWGLVGAFSRNHIFNFKGWN